VEYDEFSVNRPENRLIKTTLERLKRVVQTEENKRDLRRLLMIFEDVESSTHIDSDFQKCTGGRNMKEYEGILSFCKMFLRGLSYSTYAGKHDTLALLFPMEKLFEGYIAKKIKDEFAPKGWTVKTQHTGKYLFEEPRMFSLRPDIYLKKGDDVILMDTKWKLLTDDRAEKYGISQADMYQMYAYHKRFKNAKGVVLLYPSLGEKPRLKFTTDDDNVEIFVAYLPWSGTDFNIDAAKDITGKTVQNSQNT
jgi:5-methylcytosine-specific restriction enzyme subunit McrC